MTTANEILMTSRNCAAGMEAAKKVATKTNQDWKNEATIFSFEDGSTLVACGPQLNAYKGKVYPQYKVEADAATGEWLGDVEFVDFVEVSEWNAKSDTDNFHFDTYEENDETRAIEVVWAK
jgi:hypothetical protein